jgi:hypothetical protein
MNKSTIVNLNQFVQNFVNILILRTQEEIPTIIEDIFYNTYNFIEKNTNILTYEDNKLYEHEIFTVHFFTIIFNFNYYAPCGNYRLIV